MAPNRSQHQTTKPSTAPSKSHRSGKKIIRKHGKKSFAECSFTDKSSVKGHGEKEHKKCRITKDTCFITCTNCRGKIQRRCFECYKQLSIALNKQEVSNLREGETLLCNEATKIVMVIDWASAAKEKKLPEKIMLNNETVDVPISTTTKENVFTWNIPCQSCGTLKLPDEPPLPIKDKLKPSLKNITCHHIDIETTAINRLTMEEQQIMSHVELVIVKPLVDMDTISAAQHRRFGQGTIDGECIVFHSKPTHWGDSENVYRIIATPNPSNADELLALSSIHFDRFSEMVNVEQMQAYMKLVQCSVLPTFEKVNKGNSMRRRKSSKNSKGGYRFASLRCCRKNGAAGTNNGMELNDIQEAQSSPNMMGHHCRHISQTVQIAIAGKDGLITSVPNYYHGVYDRKFTKSHHYSPAMKGSQATGSSLLNRIQNPFEDITLSVPRWRLEDIHVEFTLARIDSAYLNKALCGHPQLNKLGFTSVSSEATKNVLNSWHHTVSASKSANEQEKLEQMDEAKDDLVESEKEAIMQNKAYVEHETVYYNMTGNHHGWISGGKVIKQVTSNINGERRYQVDIGDGKMVLFGELSLSGESGIGNHSDDDLPIRTDAELKEMIRRHTQQTKSAVLIWSSLSNYNIVFDAVAVHLDHFGSQKNQNAVKAVIENGREIPVGAVTPEMQLPKNGTIVPFSQIPGALYMPRLGVATIRDRYTELLELHHEYHCVLTQGNGKVKNTNKKNIARDAISSCTYDRGCWFGGKFYSAGGAVLDWGSRYSGQSTTAVRWRANQLRRREER